MGFEKYLTIVVMILGYYVKDGKKWIFDIVALKQNKEQPQMMS